MWWASLLHPCPVSDEQARVTFWLADSALPLAQGRVDPAKGASQ